MSDVLKYSLSAARYKSTSLISKAIASPLVSRLDRITLQLQTRECKRAIKSEVEDRVD